MCRSVFAVLVGLTLVGGSVRADEVGRRPTPTASGQLRFRLDAKAPAPTARIAEESLAAQVDTASATATQTAAKQLLLTQSRLSAPTTGNDWNCGMPVIAPSQSPDPGIAHEPKPDVQFHIRHAKPRTCGR